MSAAGQQQAQPAATANETSPSRHMGMLTTAAGRLGYGNPARQRTVRSDTGGTRHQRMQDAGVAVQQTASMPTVPDAHMLVVQSEH